MSAVDEVRGGIKVIEMLRLALRIADRAVCSDIEIYATGELIEGRVHYDTTEPETGGDDAHRADYQKIIDDALAYIELRGDALPYHMVRHPAEPAVVFFLDKEPA